LETLNDAYDFAEGAKLLESHKSAAKLLLALSQQTIECSHFIQAYSKDKKFGAFVFDICSNALTKLLGLRAFKHAASELISPKQSVTKVAEIYLATLKKLKEQLLDDSIIRTDINVSRITGAIDVIGTVFPSLMQELLLIAKKPPKYTFTSWMRSALRVRGTILINHAYPGHVRSFWMRSIAGSTMFRALIVHCY
jgi:hypothetical protein